jgi:hypothetical protein
VHGFAVWQSNILPLSVSASLVKSICKIKEKAAFLVAGPFRIHPDLSATGLHRICTPGIDAWKLSEWASRSGLIACDVTYAPVERLAPGTHDPALFHDRAPHFGPRLLPGVFSFD